MTETAQSTFEGRLVRDWLDRVRSPGLRDFQRSGLGHGFAAVATIGQWAALAWIAESLVRASTGEIPLALAALLGCGFVGGLARYYAQRSARAGRRAVATTLGTEVIEAVLPDAAGVAPCVGPAEGAAIAMDLTDDVAGYLETVTPLHVSAPVSMALIFTAVLVTDWPVAVILGTCTVLMPINMRIAGLAAEEASRSRLRAMRGMSGVILESFRGMATLRSLRATDRWRTDLARASTALNEATTEVLKRAFLSSLVMNAVVTAAVAVCATYVGLSLLGYLPMPLAPRLDLFSGLFVLLLCPMYFLPLRRISAGYHQRDRAIAAAEQIIRLTDMGSSGNETAPRAGDSKLGAAGAGPDVLREGDFIAHAGEWTAVTGASGAGKTTLLTLLAGIQPVPVRGVTWRDPESGLIGSPLLAACGWVGQRTVILDGTLAENIGLGCPGAGRAEREAAASAAGLDDLVSRLPGGLDTRIGDGGWGVSAGEARRIAVARAVLRRARVWFLDEPTAHLDSSTEEDLLDSLRLATVGCTVVVATHSSQLVRYADAHWHLEESRLHRVRGGRRR
jgi:ATP-binding cassette subfamily C protein CydD